MIFQRVQQNEVLGKIGVTDDEAQSYYETHLNEFTTAPSVTLREILVAVPGDGRGVNVAADEAAKAQDRGDCACASPPAARPSSKLAAEVSDSPSKANAGLIGPLSRERLSARICGS